MIEITDGMVERAAEAMFNTPIPPEHPVDWDCMPPELVQMVRAKARAALSAALTEDGAE